MLVYAAARRRGFGAVLDGVDGDLVASHEPDIIMRLFRTSAWSAAFREARGIARFYKGTYAPRASTTRLVLGSAVRAFAPGFVRSATLPLRQGRSIRSNIRESFINHEFAARADVPGRLRALWAHRSRQWPCTPRERQAQELGHPLIAAALERYHRVGASQGIEVRHPFFDKRLVEFCLSLPWNQKVRDGWSKRIVREAAAGYLPDGVRWRRGRWVHLGPRFLSKVAQGSDAFLSRELEGDMSVLAPYADLAKLRILHGRRLEGRIEDLQTLWTAAILSCWLRKTKSTRYDVASRANGPAASPRLLAR
jgi:asparagine synthase (glutamine-hydrolysing)